MKSLSTDDKVFLVAAVLAILSVLYLLLTGQIVILAQAFNTVFQFIQDALSLMARGIVSVWELIS